MPEIWATIEKFEKLIEKIHKFDLTYAFCSHFHCFCPFWLIFYIKYHNVHRDFPYLLSNLWTTTQNVFKKYFWHLKVKVSCFNGFLFWFTLRKKLFGGTVPPNNTLFGRTVPPNNTLLGGTVPPNNTLFGGTLKISNLKYLMEICKIYHVWYPCIYRGSGQPFICWFIYSFLILIWLQFFSWISFTIYFFKILW